MIIFDRFCSAEFLFCCCCTWMKDTIAVFHSVRCHIGQLKETNCESGDLTGSSRMKRCSLLAEFLCLGPIYVIGGTGIDRSYLSPMGEMSWDITLCVPRQEVLLVIKPGHPCLMAGSSWGCCVPNNTLQRDFANTRTRNTFRRFICIPNTAEYKGKYVIKQHWLISILECCLKIVKEFPRFTFLL